MYFLRNFHKIYIPMLSQSKCGGNRDNKKRCKRYIYRIVCTYIKLGILRLWRIQKQVSSSHHLNRVIFKSAFFEMIFFHLSITTFLLLDYERELSCRLRWGGGGGLSFYVEGKGRYSDLPNNRVWPFNRVGCRFLRN